MTFVDAVALSIDDGRAFRRRSYRPASVWLWWDGTGGEEQLVIGSIIKGRRHVQAAVTLTPNLILARDWIVEDRTSARAMRRIR